MSFLLSDLSPGDIVMLGMKDSNGLLFGDRVYLRDDPSHFTSSRWMTECTVAVVISGPVVRASMNPGIGWDVHHLVLANGSVGWIYVQEAISVKERLRRVKRLSK